jgi:hypothetical protein
MNAFAPAEFATGAVPLDNLDPGLAFLGQASARHVLVEQGEMSIDEAIDGLTEPVEQIFGPRCTCESFCGACRAADARHSHRRTCAARRPTPQVTIEAILYCVRDRGVAALREPANIARLRTCDAAAKAQINERIARLGAKA